MWVNVIPQILIPTPHLCIFNYFKLATIRKYTPCLDIDQYKCSRLHETGSIILGNSVSIFGLLPNSTNYRIVTLAGITNMDGSCKGSDFSDPYGTWNNVIVEASVTITLKDYHAP